MGMTYVHAEDNTEITLKRKCLKNNPLVVGETDQILLGKYVQVCDKNNEDQKNAYLVLAAERFYQIGKAFKALELVNYLESLHVHSNTLTDVKFLAATKIANDSIQQMRNQEMRYLASESTYPAGKELVASINAAKPASVLKEEVKSDAKPVVRQKRQETHIVKPVKVKPVTTKPVDSQPALPSSNPFATLN